MDEILWDNVRPTDGAYLRGRTEGKVGTDGRSPYQRGRDEERAAVLAYLRALGPYPGGAYADAFAKAIEDGEHLEPPGSGGASSG